MGTRSNIAVEQPNGEVVVAYCHYDGYPEYNGQLLNDHYNNKDIFLVLKRLLQSP